jgi:hypothetical protein
MALYNVKLPDGSTLKLEGPDGASDQEVIARAQTLVRQERPNESYARPVMERTGIANRRPGYLGATAQSFTNGATAGWGDKIAAALDAVDPFHKLTAPDAKSVWDGSSLSDAYSANLAHEQDVTKAGQEDHPILSALGSVGGALASPLARLIRGGGVASSLANSALYGGSYGAGQAKSGDELNGLVSGAAEGVAGDLLGRGVVGGLSHVLAPVGNQAVQRLRAAGVPLTFGQIVGGPVKAAEDKLTSVPGVGDLIQRGRRRSIEGFNRAAINEALSPIAAKLPGNIDVGRSAAEFGQQAASDAYDTALNSMSFTPDSQFVADLTAARNSAVQLPDHARQFFDTVLKRDVDPFTGAAMDGRQLQSIKRGLDKRIASLSGPTASPADQLAIEPLEQVRDALMGNAFRANPDKVEAYRNADAAFSRMQRINDATARMKSDKAFSPLSFSGAVSRRGYGTSTAKVARGDAAMQDLSDAASEVLPSSIPDSGTAGRVMMAAAIGGPAAMIAPKALLADAAASIPYIPGIDRLIETLIAGERPAAVKAAGSALRKKAPLAGRLAGSSLLYGLGEPQ